MKIDGKAIADSILKNLHTRVSTLKQQGITPTLAVIQVGDDPGSTAYIKQKQKAAERTGAKLILRHQSSAISNQHLKKIISQFNDDTSIHGIIVQRPLPKGLHVDSVLPIKDVDGFLPGSPYPIPVASAVKRILAFCFQQFNNYTIQQFEYSVEKQHRFYDWLKTKRIVVLGRGETAGKPIAETLIKRGCNVTIVHSQTPHPDNIIRAADIVISCVGKPNVVRRDNIKQGALFISVGISRDNQGKLHGDYEEEEIKDVATFYTPTPGGVGPVNVACLMANLFKAANKLL